MSFILDAVYLLSFQFTFLFSALFLVVEAPCSVRCCYSELLKEWFYVISLRELEQPTQNPHPLGPILDSSGDEPDFLCCRLRLLAAVSCWSFPFTCHMTL